MDPLAIVMIVSLIMSVVIHEMAHGYAALWQGDPTARLAGRLTPNPIVHLDPIMSVLLPGLLLVTGSPILFGAAKPVPYNPYNFTNQRWGEAIVAFAGPLSNIVIALIFIALIHASGLLGLSETFTQLAYMVVVLNLFLAFFNLVPIPPLDGSKILPKLLPFDWAMRYNDFRARLEQNVGLAFLIIIFLFTFVLLQPLYYFVQWLTGILL